jgi:hypothetical protein
MTVKEIAREAAAKANKLWLGLTTSQEPCDQASYIADAAAAAALCVARDRIAKNLPENALAEIDELLAEYFRADAVPSDAPISPS